MTANGAIRTESATSVIGKFKSVLGSLSKGANSDDRGLSFDAGMVFILRIAGAGLAYLMQILLARGIGEHDYGLFAFAWIWVIILGRAGTFGFGESAVRFIARYDQQRKFGLVQTFLRSARLFVAAGSAAIAALAILFLQLSPPFLLHAYIWPLTLAMACVPLFANQELYEGIARAKGWNILALVPIFVFRPVFILIAFAIAVLAGAPATVQTTIIAVICALLAANVLQILLVEHRLRRNRLTQGKAHAASSGSSVAPLWFKASLPLFFVHWCEELLTNSDVVMLGLYLPAEQVAIYFATSKTLLLAAFVPFAVAIVIGRRFSMHHASGDREALQAIAHQGAFWTFWPTAGAVTLILLCGYPMLWMFGPAFTDGYPVLVVLAAGMLLRSAFGQAEDLLIMVGHAQVNLYTAIGALAANIALNMVLIPHFGLIGAALATSLTMVTRAGLLTLLAHKLTGTNTLIQFRLPPKKEKAERLGVSFSS